MMSKFFKKKYEKKLFSRALDIKENREFIITRLEKEWEQIELAMKKEQRKQKLYYALKSGGASFALTLLGMVAVCGVITIAVVAPNIFSAFGRLGRRRRYFDKYKTRQHIYNFKRQGFIKVKRNKSDDTMEITLTGLGRKEIVKRALGDIKIVPQEPWDKIWRIVIFDIPEQHKWSRDGLRTYLKRMGFFQLQKSTFVFPYPCREEIDFLGRLYNTTHNIRFVETKSINYDTDLKKHFSLDI